ncbi:hypothetical protein FRAAL6748 [Frankia alni ACN14a]|uniref:Uncharacterized protein n=1 Tax=Frankia alni (strain DSM 45986 / CECT 9034 / ACN14a) TaxID=326424 RepID=Q0RB17_FRAAA|nr:hypothetical protein FRAAL6748 [Frankia alni ACN14a]
MLRRWGLPYFAGGAEPPEPPTVAWPGRVGGGGRGGASFFGAWVDHPVWCGVVVAGTK